MLSAWLLGNRGCYVIVLSYETTTMTATMLRYLFLLANLSLLTTAIHAQTEEWASDEIFMVCETPPRFKGCDNQDISKEEARSCTTTKSQNYVFENLIYPESVKANEIQGTVIASFIIEKDGTTTGESIIRDPGSGLGKEVLRIIQGMNADGPMWTPGYQRGKAVRVKHNMPIRFEIKKEKKVRKKASRKIKPSSKNKSRFYKKELAEGKSTHTPPRFPGCEDNEVPGKYKYLCSQKKFVNFLDRYINYPKTDVKSTTQGKVIVSFIIELDGSVSSAKVERTPSESLGAECLAAINLLNQEEYVWTPAALDGKPVRSRIEMPVNFRLGYKSIKSKKPMTYVTIPNIMPSYPIDDAGQSLIESIENEETIAKIYEDVEVSPFFKTCAGEYSQLIDKFKCSRKGYTAYFKKHINYPTDAQMNRIQGSAKVECIIEIDGTVSSPRLLRDLGHGTGEEAMRLITEMKDSVGIWTPGEIGGQAVRTRVSINIPFRLDESTVNPLVVIMDKKKNVIHDCVRVSDINLFRNIDGAKVKKVKTTKAQQHYGEKGRYGVYLIRLPKGQGRLPAALRKQEEVEAYEMYFEGLTMTPTETDRKIEVAFDDINEDGTMYVYNLSGRTILEQPLSTGIDSVQEIDLSDAKGKVFLLSIQQKDLVHTRIVEF